MLLVWLPLLSLGLAAHQPVARRLAPRARAAAPRARASADASHADVVGALPVVYRGPNGTPLLDMIASPADIKRLAPTQLRQLAMELRHETLCAVSQTGGHLGSSLGVVELTVALHYVFNAPEDPICWDVSHQVYPHKILTGRRARMSTLRQKGGLSGFAKRSESPYDPFGAGHSSTSISAALGMAVGHKLNGISAQRNSIAVIGDGAITGGMAYEAMNNAAYLNTKVVVVLNDNGQVSLPTGTQSAGGVGPAGALSAYTSRLLTSKPFLDFRSFAKSFSSLLPEEIQAVNKRIDAFTRGALQGGTLFEELGFYYVGPVDGHDLANLVPILENIRDRRDDKPVLLHIKTEKGYGYPPAVGAPDKYHGVPKFDVPTGYQYAGPKSRPSYTSIFAAALIEHAQDDINVVAITAAMPGGTGIDKFGKRFPKRTFDVGIAEQHAVTFAAGLAIEGLKPFVAIYSTFLQRGYDQVVHDVVTQKLPVRFILDRAGLVGNDGPTHHGSFDLAYLGCLPDLVIMAPSDELELLHMIATAYELESLPSAIRFPRGNALGLEAMREQLGYDISAMPAKGTALPIGRGRYVKRADASRSKRVALLSLGTRLAPAMQAARALEEDADFGGTLGVTVADARFMKPLDMQLLRELAAQHDVLITIEEGSVGGFGDHVLHVLALDGALDEGKLRVRPMVLPDHFIEAGTQPEQYDEAGLSAPFIVATVRKLLGKSRVLV
ncbi:hypothetical protein KFE25_001673 [Diacronema lutheri]|uniref:1-deoxy-D-xylulose-5-phosphate synthase n=1 Tax=Diacronema lutheri TaxID=2081491 RepID=A0A8J5XH34_DIALT|nr:hypothetical protein KFE25_001673 [Diacronema lutheri]